MREMIVPGVSAIPTVSGLPANPPPRDAREIEQALEAHRRELTAYAYRMLGSPFEAEDAVQKAMLRAWRGYGRFEGRAGLRSWLYRITTNVCLDALDGRKRRARPMDLGSAGVADIALLGEPLPEATWVEPVPDERVVVAGGDPAEVAIARESVRLAFVTAIQRLPPRQRAVLILREVLHWQASEVAELLETSVASVNSALQRARAALQAVHVERDGAAAGPLDPAQQALLERYVEAFESYDMDRLTALLREDTVWNMPPYALWLQTHEDITTWCLGPGIGCQGSRLVATRANGSPAYGQYKPSPDGGLEPWALQVLELSGDRIAAVTFFLDTARFFPLFGLPNRLPA